MKKEIIFSYTSYNSAEELEVEDADLLQQAKNILDTAYAPYSNFRVGAAALLENGAIVTGTNQENASYPVGICAERVLLSAASVMHNNVPVNAIAISYHNLNGKSNKPISPCGMCRQSLQEYESRMQQPIKIILAGQTGKIYVLPNASSLLPLNFSGDDMT